MKKIEVAYQVINRRDQVESKRKVFKTEKAMRTYLAKLEEKGTLYRVLGYADA